MTLKELAKLANVSVSTVSRVINGDENSASAKTREKIWKLVRETNYIPNTAAQKLRKGIKNTKMKTHNIACVFARTTDGLSDPFFSQIFQAIEQEAIKNSCTVTGVFSAQSMNSDGIYDDLILSEPDGIILIGRYSKPLYTYLSKKFKNIVYTGLNKVSDECDQIICDGYTAAKTAVKRLHSLGHSNIGYIGEMSNEARYRGYFDALVELKIPVERNFIIDAPLSVKGGYEAVEKLLKISSDTPTAVFCANDITAIGVLKALSETNIKVPDDISVISIDNIEMCQFVSPMLTSIDIPKTDMGKFAFKILLDRIKGGHKLPVKLEVPFKIIQRESCAARK